MMKWALLLPLTLTLTLASATDLPAGPLATEDSPWDYLIFDDQHRVTAEIGHHRYTAKVEQADGFVFFQLHPKLPWYPQPLMVLRPDGDGWRDATGNRWSAKAAEEIPPGTAHPKWTPLKVTVTGTGGVRPGKFRYRCVITSEEGEWKYPRYGYRDAEDGFEILAPANCKLDLTVEHPDVLQGYGQGIRALRKDNAPEITATAPLGITLTGTVVDDETGKPEPGAWVFPAVVWVPGTGPDMDRGVQVADDGSYTLHGISPSMGVIAVDHGGHREGRRADSGEIRLSKEKVHGLFQPNNPAPPIKNVYPGAPIRGRIILEDGTDAHDWTLVCETGHRWGIFAFATATKDAPDGSFSIPAGALDPDEDGNCLIVAAAPGAAPVLRKVSAYQLRKGICRVKLPAGHGISAEIKTPADFKGSLTAELQLNDAYGTNARWPQAARGMASQSLQITPGQPLRFEHVADGSYLLTVHGEGIGTVSRKIEISGNDVKAGEITCLPPGSVRGSLHRDFLDLPYAEGWISVEDGGKDVSFRTDAEGNFHVGNLPAGKAEINFRRSFGDVMARCTAEANIESGKETTVQDSDFSGRD